MKLLWKPVNSPLGPVPRVNPWLWKEIKYTQAENRDVAYQEQLKNVLYATTAMARAFDGTTDSKMYVLGL